MMDEGVVDRLRVLGMSLYEARIYVGLLRHGPQNGNEVSRSAGIPSSKVYSTLERLVSKGIVHSVRTGAGTQYICIAPDELVHRFREEFDEPIVYLEKTLPGVAAFEPAGEVLTVSGLDTIRENTRYIIGDAGKEIYISVWADDVEYLREALVAAHERGVSIFGMLYGEEPLDVGSWLVHSYQQIVTERIDGRMLTVVADREEALIAHIPRQGQASAVRTRNPVLALVAQEYLHHDIVLQRAQLAFGFDEWDRWWQADPDLRTIILASQAEEVSK
ncbi:MAG TPA: helix-turn-helix domain-containing protein [Gaiellaceae bacterium]|jgi:sugar-specific transcriptional regulator TrmB